MTTNLNKIRVNMALNQQHLGASFVSCALILYGNTAQTLVNSFDGLLNCELCGLDCRVITTECSQNTCPLYKHVTPIL